MTFANIALKNVRKKFGSYLVYFFSTTFSVLIFNLFCSMYYNPSFEAYRFGTGKMSTLFKGSAVAVLLFAAIFVLYSGSYFIKTQKKEIALYSLLGMRKEQISLMMFFETFFIGLIAVVTGTLVGTSTAGYFTSLLMRFMAAGTSITMTVEPRAIVVTIIAFIVLFIISGIRAYKTIYKYTLIELLSANKKSEGVPSYSKAGALSSIVLLVIGYIISATMNMNAGGMKLLFPAFIVVMFISAGTFLLFRNFIPMAVGIFKKKRPLYYKTSNFISISQIAFRLKANSKMLSVVALLCAVTITMISASYSLYNGLADAVDFYAPYSYLTEGITDEQHSEMLKAVNDTGEVSVTADDKISLCNVKIQNNNYALQEGKDNAENLGKETDAYLLSESMYLNIIKHTQAQTGDYENTKTSFTGGLSDTECFFLDGNVTNDYCKDLVGESINVNMNGTNTSFVAVGSALHKYIGLNNLYKHPTIIVSDNNYQKSIDTASEITTYYGLMFNDEMASANTVAVINRIIPSKTLSSGMPSNMNYIEMYKLNFAMYGPYVFIGLFIGVLFMLALGSVLYYKLIMEAQEEAPRYEILRKTGMTKREIRSSVAKQVGLVYGVPLGLGLVHTIFALFTYNRMMEEIGQETPTLQNAIIVMLIFVAVYGAFYLVSTINYHKIVWKRANGGSK